MAHRTSAARAGGAALVSEEIEYWRELAAQYQRELEALRARVLRYLDAPSPENAAVLLDAAHARLGWMDEIDRIDSAAELKTTDVKTALDDLWFRVAGDE